jgi:formylglycine-generating enzyme required for sulfatase activity
MGGGKENIMKIGKWAGVAGHDNYGFWAMVTVKGIDIRFRWIEPGKFLMGSPETEPKRSDDELQHEVTLTKGFWMAETTCTQELWEAVMGDNPSRFKGPRRPVEAISWEEPMRFIGILNDLRDDLNLRLPTEAEWEYACRAGATGPFSFGDNITTDQVNYNGNHPYKGGREGIYRNETVDVWEWCADRYGKYEPGKSIDPSGSPDGALRVLRGGGWYTDGRRCRSAYRSWGWPALRFDDIGFRLARDK